MPLVKLPRILEPVVGDAREIFAEGTTVGEAIDSLLESHPGLRVHLFDESGSLRPHVLCFVNGEASRLTEDMEIEEDGSIAFLQAVSGG